MGSDPTQSKSSSSVPSHAWHLVSSLQCDTGQFGGSLPSIHTYCFDLTKKSVSSTPLFIVAPVTHRYNLPEQATVKVSPYDTSIELLVVVATSWPTSAETSTFPLAPANSKPADTATLKL